MRTRYARSRNAIDSPGMPRPPVAKLAMNPTEIATCDITLRQPLTRAVSRLLAAGVVIVLVGPALVGPALGMAYPALPFSLGALLAGLLIWGRASRRIAAQTVARATPPGWSADLLGVARNVLRRTRWVQPMAALHALLREAARDGAGGTILRLGMPGQLRPLIPLDVPFEPLALDESDETARHLSGARPTQRDDLTWLRVMRNIRLGGGWPLAVGALTLTALGALNTWRTGQPTWLLGVGILLLAAVVTGRVGGGRRGHFLMVPGGVIVHRAGKTQAPADPRYYRKAESVFCIYPAGRHQWIVAVADEWTTATCAGTRAEAELALRAWASPLPSPTREMLADWVLPYSRTSLITR
jgi:hypothetical protein